MEAGASAREAVEIAIRRGTHCRAPIHEIRMKGKARGSHRRNRGNSLGR
jgi:hypothetical protein